MRILAIGAHFDDVELGCAGTLLKHRDANDEIHILVVTHSGYSSPTNNFKRLSSHAKKEGQQSARILKAKLHCCGEEPLSLIPTENLVLKIDNLINEIKPDRVYTHQPNDSHADHAAVGYVSLRACRKCDEVLLYRSNWYITEDTMNDNYYVDISRYAEEKTRLLKLFKSEMVKVNYSWVDFVRKQNSASGAKVGVHYAETFHITKMLWR